MNEVKWLKCKNLRLMLECRHWKSTSRKLRLFACAACRLYWHLLKDERSRYAVEVAERFADGLASAAELAEIQEEARSIGKYNSDGLGPATCCWDIAPYSPKAAQEAVDQMLMTLEDECFDGEMPEKQSKAENRILTDLLREIVGNPFHPAVIAPTILHWNDGTVSKLAQGIYDDRAFDRLPILADALEEAGCTDAELLAHCRQPGSHVRGCWVIDLLLGKG
jgi:hypothetical protein